ncbi:stage II sporulation protein R [Thalassobacillus devorans]|uniref:Stage II sporulation protein R n=1 Tax=Thalassobacillus devorans TaxID=279813 RepID=A0ABQ1NWG8_9BACI|nr:stage II sporulation protein R [Thalassobacillus devorans]NIK28453.1 stage II sporulation protein R [Thalassobacillus devorans]GGC86103.1 stage II sporulation protein R [Thalassobacillus devorans]
MKKALISLIIITIFITASPITTTGATTTGPEYQVIPDEAIRLRILANSNGEADQELKREIRDKVNEEITTWVEKLTSIESARTLIERRIGEVEKIVAETLENAEVDQAYQVKYDDRVEFPTKLYGNFIYPAGTYEAILITLGAGKGDNWWCVLFPPLCFLDFGNGTSTASAADAGQETSAQPGTQEVEVEFFLLKVWNQIKSLFS